MRKILLSLLLSISICFSVFAFDLVVPSPEDTSYVLLNDSDEFIVDDTVFMKSAFNREIMVERYTDNITVITYPYDKTLVVLFNATLDEMLDAETSIDFSTENPDVLIINSPIDFPFLEEIDAEDLYISGGLKSEDRAMLRRGDFDFVELEPSSILSITSRGIDIISGSKNNKDGVYVTCPECGTIIYVPLF